MNIYDNFIDCWHKFWLKFYICLSVVLKYNIELKEKEASRW